MLVSFLVFYITVYNSTIVHEITNSETQSKRIPRKYKSKILSSEYNNEIRNTEDPQKKTYGAI